MRILLSIFFLLIFSFSRAQVKTQKLDRAKIPTAIQYRGNLKSAVTWTDNLGTHYVITTETGTIDSKIEADSRDAELFAYHYLLAVDTLQLTWKVYDFIKNCPVDLKANFVKNTFAVTDLNKNGQAEVWLMYQTVCRGDVSPSDMKIIMYEGNRKYAARGTTKVQETGKKYNGGNYSFDEAFKNAPDAFKNYAKALWQKNRMEVWE